MSAKKYFIVYSTDYSYSKYPIAVTESYDAAKRLVTIMHPNVAEGGFDGFIDEVPMVMFKWPSRDGDDAFEEVR